MAGRNVRTAAVAEGAPRSRKAGHDIAARAARHEPSSDWKSVRTATTEPPRPPAACRSREDSDHGKRPRLRTAVYRKSRAPLDCSRRSRTRQQRVLVVQQPEHGELTIPGPASSARPNPPEAPGFSVRARGRRPVRPAVCGESPAPPTRSSRAKAGRPRRRSGPGLTGSEMSRRMPFPEHAPVARPISGKAVTSWRRLFSAVRCAPGPRSATGPGRPCLGIAEHLGRLTTAASSGRTSGMRMTSMRKRAVSGPASVRR